jgi:RNA polymerase sigma-70 factor (ECF subfamily)
VADSAAVSDGRWHYAQEAMGYRGVLFSAAYRMTHNPADAEDLVQETYLKAHKNCGSFEGDYLRAWLNRILANTFINTYHAHRRRPEVLGLDAQDDWFEAGPTAAASGIGRDPADVVLAAAPDEALRAALRSLPVTFQRVVLLADVDGYSYKEIAEIVHVPIGTVMSRLSRGRRALRKALVAGDASRSATQPFRVHGSPGSLDPCPARS